MPPWVVLSLACHRVRTPLEAQGALLELTFAFMSGTFQYQPSLLILTTHSLAQFGIITPMQRIVEAFLLRGMYYPAFHFNMFIQAISGFVKSEEVANRVVTVLEAMTARRIPLWLESYQSLMTDRFVTLQLTKYLRARMIHDGIVPKAEHLEAYLRIFSNHGAIHESKEYLRAIQEYSFHYLHHLLQLDNHRTHVKSPVLHVSHHAVPTFWSGSKQSVDIYDWTTALVALASDRKTSAEALLAIFDKARTKTKHFRPTVVTYTVVLRGLLFRKAFHDAMRIWNQLLDSELLLDRKALTIGVQVLTRVGRPHDAFYLLDSFADAHSLSTAPSQGTTTTNQISISSPTAQWINIIVINEFMVALLRTSRPDVIFKLWDNLHLLYGLLPNDATLNILLKAAILASKMDRRSVRGAIHHLNPFKFARLRSSELPPPFDRAAVSQSILGMLADADPPSVVAIWRERDAHDVARDVFREMIFGNWPSMSKVQAPAQVVREAGKGGDPLYPLVELAKSVALPFTRKEVDARGGGEGGVEGDSAVRVEGLPSVVPSESTFSVYIQLLGLSSRADEIPLALAWMRYLNITPSLKTLSIALVFWAEVSLRGPMFEEWAEKHGRSEYQKLERWIGEWVGESSRPTEGDIGKALVAVAKMRDSSFSRHEGVVRRY
ncbi:hypothetical protein F5I97DRAFT_1983970 [Phlebopus sp. FC_14]|nr:hypothetical protein F5I97DRAFT_1983970 [Phlebopus sp. FC_14]